MAKLDQQTQQARRDRILDAAERCFVHRGFHRSSMHDICREAGISPGALYIYFASKEELIAGLCERETVQFAEHLGQLRDATDFMAALRGLAEHYCFSQPQEKLRLHIEIGAEAGRNEAVRTRVLEIDAFVARRFEELIDRLREAGRIAPAVDSAVLSRILSIVGDGLFWHRALNPEFDTRAVLPALMTMIETLINPVTASAQLPAIAAPSGKKTMKKTRLLPLLAAIMAGSGIAALAAPAHAEAVAVAQVSQAPSVSVTGARRATLTETILVTGSLVAREEVLVTPQIDGLRLMEVHGEQGDRVKKGQLLARLDRTTLDAQLARLEAQDKRSEAAIAQARNQIASPPRRPSNRPPPLSSGQPTCSRPARQPRRATTSARPHRVPPTRHWRPRETVCNWPRPTRWPIRRKSARRN